MSDVPSEDHKQEPVTRADSGRLLVVDDDTEFLSPLCEFLSISGYEVKGVTSGNDALAELKGQTFDLLLTDLMMPGMDGIMLLRAALEIDQRLVGIIITGQGTIQTAVDAMKLGAYDYVVKPLEFRMLGPLISRAMEVRRLRMENVQLREAVEVCRLKQALHETENAYRTIFENTGTATTFVEEDGTISLANKEFEVLSGYLREEIEGSKDWREFVAAEDVERMKEYRRLRYIDPQAAPTNYEFHFIDRRGKIKDVSIVVDVIPGTRKEVASLLDITERKRVETLVRIQRDLALALGALSSLQEGLGHCLDAAIQASGLDCGGIYLVDTPTGSINLYSSKGLSDEFVENVSHLEADSQKARIVMAGRPLYVSYQDLHSSMAEAELREGLRFLAVVPFGEHGRVMGCLNVSSHVLDDAPAYAREALETIAAQIGTVIDRLQAANALQESEEKYKDLTELLPQSVFELDDKGNMLFLNRYAFEISGYTQDDFNKGLTVLQMFIPEDRDRVLENFQRRLRGEQTSGVEYTAVRKDGSTFPVLIYSSLIVQENKITGIRGLAIDITDRKRNEQAIHIYQTQLRSLVAELSLIEERERRRIATELHDNISQTLALSKIKLGILKNLASSGDLAQHVDEIGALVDQSIQYTRSLISDLSPPLLNEIGLEAAVEWLVERFRGQYGISIDFKDDGESKPVKEEVRSLLFMVVRELLINIVKHAQAGHAEVSLQRHGEYMRIIVRDDGAGFNAMKIRPYGRDAGSGFGLFNTRERLEGIGGHIEIRSEQGQGTRVAVMAPLAREDRGERP